MAKRGPKLTLDQRTKTALINLTLAGKTILQAATMLGIAERTVYNWFAIDPQLHQAIKDAKANADKNVEAALFERANGYSHPAEKLFYDKDTGKVVRAETVEHYPPDPTSMIFWLKNRQPEKWRDKQELDLTKDITIVIAGDEKDL